MLGFALVLAAQSTWGQIVPEGGLKLQSQFNFSNPGARSLGIAGAFVARADDATAAYANPAGLIHLKTPEISLEGRHWDTEVLVRDSAGESSRVTGSQSSASFFAISYPIKKFTLALYRHELGNLEVSGRTTEFSSASLDLKITGIGLAAGYEVVPSFRLGLAIIAYRSELDAMATTLDGITSRATGDDDEFGFILGYQADLGKNWDLAFVIREGPSFEVTYDPESETGEETFSVPDIAGFGVAWQATHRLMASLDYYFIQYSTTVNGDRRDGGRYVVPDAHEVRLGFEYTLWEYTSSPAFRLGVWRDPDHQIRFQPDGDSPEAMRRAEEFPKGDEEIHFSLGLGVVIGHLQLDAGADFSDPLDTYSLSVVWFF